MQSHLSALRELTDELGDDLLGVLVGPVHVVPSRNNDGHAKGSVVRFCEKFCPRFGSCIGVCRFQDLDEKGSFDFRYNVDMNDAVGFTELAIMYNSDRILQSDRMIINLYDTCSSLMASWSFVCSP